MDDLQWRLECPALAEQAPGPELVRRLAEIDIEVLTDDELLEYLMAARSQAAWAESLQERAVCRFAELRHRSAASPVTARPGSPKPGRTG